MGTLVELAKRERTKATAPGRAVYTVREVAELLGIHLGGAYELVRSGAIPAERLGRRWVIPCARFEAWLSGTGEVR
jgi:excisionase family DNA binding protein